MVTVLHANRALQAATLSAFCLQDPTNVPPGFEATFRFEAIRPGTAGVEERQPFDAAVVARGGKDGPGAAGFTDWDAARLRRQGARADRGPDPDRAPQARR